MSEINTTTEAVERLAAALTESGPHSLDEAAATLRALAGERDALRVGRGKERAAYERVIALKDERIAEHAEVRDRVKADLTAARDECEALASQVQEAQAQVARLRRGWLTTLQGENSCDGSGKPCDAKRCGCVEEMEMLMREDDERAALAEAPRHD
jgi:chromosome segregation ATPase